MGAREWAAKARAVLLEMGIIGEDDTDGTFGNGDDSARAFEVEEDADEDDLPFDFGIIHAEPRAVFLPEAYSEPALCPQCRGQVDRELSALRWDEDGEPLEIDLRSARITCPKCGRQLKLDELTDDWGQKFYVSDAFVEFSDSRLPTEEWVKEFNQRMGVEHEVMEYGYT